MKTPIGGSTILPAPLAMASAIALLLAAAPGLASEAGPLPPSPVITGVEWAPKDSIIYMADDSDNWPLAWADDGHLYTAYGDGWGFEPHIDIKLSLGFARVSGDPPDITAVNIRSETGERLGDGRSGKKASGLIQVDGVFYMFVRNADGAGNETTLAWSDDYLETWTWADWTIPELGFCAFVDYGPNYEGARDAYVYFLSPDTPSAYEETDDVILGRAPKDGIADRGAYEFFAGFNEEGAPVWSRDISERRPVAALPGCANRLDVSYNPGLGRYFMTMRSRARAGGRDQFSIYDAPAPWGPWTTVYYTETWGDETLADMHFQEGWGESARIPPKWISEDGQSFHLVFAGRDHFAVRAATLTVAEPGE